MALLASFNGGFSDGEFTVVVGLALLAAAVAGGLCRRWWLGLVAGLFMVFAVACLSGWWLEWQGRHPGLEGLLFVPLIPVGGVIGAIAAPVAARYRSASRAAA